MTDHQARRLWSSNARRRSALGGGPARRRRPLALEALEARTLLSTAPIDLADPSVYGLSGMLASSAPSISADGQLVAFASNADNLVPNDLDGSPDAFVFDRSTGVVRVVSVGPDGQAAGIGGYSSPMTPVISPDGRYVAFENNLGNVLPGDTGDQLYVRDLITDTTSLVSAPASGAGGGNGISSQPIFSADSRHLVFQSYATNLVSSISSSGIVNLFERDLTTNTTTLISISLDGKSEGNNNSGPAGVSADGRFVAFQSLAQNLVALGTGGTEQVFLRDLTLGTTTLVSVDATGLAGAGGHNSLTPDSQVISDDGRYVVFHSQGSDLVATPTNGQESYLRDLQSGTTILLSASAVDGRAVPSGATYGASEVISPDGRFAAFGTGAANVVSLPTNGLNVFVRNLQTGVLSLASVNAAGTAGGNGGSGLLATSDNPGSLSFSPNGRYIAFRSLATNLTTNVTTATRNLYVHNLDTGQTRLVTPNLSGTDGGAGDADSVGSAVFSADGRYVAFEDVAGDLVPGDNNRDRFGNNANDVFVRDLTAGATTLVSSRSPLLPAAYTAAGGATLSSVNYGFLIDGALSSVSADGRYVAFTSSGSYPSTFSDLAPGVTFSGAVTNSHVFVRDRQTGAIQVVDLDPSGIAIGGYNPVLTPDGRFVAFIGYTNLLPTGVAATDVHDREIYVRNLQTNTTSVVSLDPAGTHDAPVNGRELAISADGRYVSWTSYDTLAVAGTTVSSPGNDEMIFLRDRQTGSNDLVSHDPANDGQVRGASRAMSMTSDGRYVAFVSNDPGLTGQGSGSPQVFRWDRTTGQSALVSINAAGAAAGNSNGDLHEYPPVMTPDGRFISFTSDSTDLTATPITNGFENVFLRDMGDGASTPSTVLISVNLTGAGAGDSSSIEPSISADGATIAFTSDASNLTNDPDLNHSHNVFVRNMTTNQTALVSINAAGSGSANGPNYSESKRPILSPNGRFVAFLSNTPDLVAGFVSGSSSIYFDDLYLRDLQQGSTRLVSVNQSGTTGGNADQTGQPVAFSGDSSALFFGSADSNLYPADRNGLTTNGYDSVADVFAVHTAGFSSISGQAFNDLNANGANGGEPGLSYWTVFLDANKNGTLDPGEESALTDVSGHYAFNDLTPGSYTVSVVPRAGYSPTLPASTGTYTVTIATNGQSVGGKDFGEFLGTADLVTSEVTFTPLSAAPGQLVKFRWTVTDATSIAASGDWQDVVYLSPTPDLGTLALPVALVPHTGSLAGLGNYTGAATFALPTRVGSYYVVVRADRRNQVDEGPTGAGKTNNLAASPTPLTVAIPSLTLGQLTSGQVASAQPDRYFQINVPAGRSLLLALAGATGTGPLELYVKRGALPAPYDFDFAARQPGQSGQLLIVPQTQPGIYYVLVHGVSVAAASATFTLTATQPGLGLQTPGLTSGGNGGKVTIPVHGTDLTPSSVVTLVSGATVVSPVSIDFLDASLLYATFDLTGRPAGSYSLRVVDGGQSASLPGAFNITPARGPDLQVHLATPSAIRANTHALHITVELVVTFANDGDTDMPAPIFQLACDLGSLDIVSGARLTIVPSLIGSGIQFVGAGRDSPAGTLRAGDHGEVKLLLTLPPIVILGGGGGGGGGTITVGKGSGVNLTLSTLPTDTTPVNWDQFKSQLQPPSIPNDAWNLIYSNFTAAIGSTYGQLQSSVVTDTAYLNQIGVANPSFDQILAFELLRADAALPVPTLGSNVDASFATPGLGLDFGRTFYQSISGRYHSGSLGRGWVSNWDVSEAIQTNGSVLISDAGLWRLFTKKVDGSFAAQPGDYGTLTLVNGLVRLREKDGTILNFRVDGRINDEQDTNGNRITAGYNATGQLTSLTHSDGGILSLTYNAQGLVSAVTDPTGRVASYSYGASGQQLLSVTSVRGTTSYSYVTGQTAAEEHALAAVTDPDGAQTHYTYDAQGRLTGLYQGTAASQIDPLSLGYTSPGGVTFTDASGSSTILFNQFGQPAVVTDALGHSTGATYDASGNLTGIKLPGGLTYVYAYDAQGNVTQMTDPLGQKTDFNYSKDLNQLTSYTDAKGNSTAYAHDAQGNLTSISYADGSHQNFSYDPLGNLTESINARRQVIGNTYNSAGQVTKEVFDDGSLVNDTYDVHGNLITAALTDTQGNITTTTLKYDAADRLIEVDQPGGLFLKFTYKPGGQRTRSVDQTGYTINYQYDSAGRLTGLTDAGNNPIVTYVYDTSGRLSEKDLRNGTYTTYQYDAAGELLHLINHAPHPAPGQGGPVNSRFDYTYDALGEVATLATSDGAWLYSYDADGQLTHAVFTSNNTAVLPNQDLQYNYDALGNRTSTVINGVTTTYNANNLNEYTTVGTATYTYDADGNLTSKSDGGVTTTYTFDDLSRLVGVSSSAGTSTYSFDPLGNLASTTQNGQMTQYLNDPTGFGNVTGLGTLVGSFANGVTVAHDVYGLGIVSRIDSTGNAAYVDFDQLGSTSGITNAAGSYVNQYSYLPFGETTTIAAALPNPYTYLGQFGVTADGSGNLRMGFRNYDQATGQFISEDPLGLSGEDANIRRYVHNDPILSIDPLGLVKMSADTPVGGLKYDVRTNSLEAKTDFKIFNVDSAGSITVGNKHFKIEIEAKDYKPFLDKLIQELEKHKKEIQALFDAWAKYRTPIGPALQLTAAITEFIPFDFSFDPNNLVGPAGVGAPGWINQVPQPLAYYVEFENDPKQATVAAQDVTVTEQLDPNLDWSSFQLGNIQFGAIMINVPDGLRSFATSVDTTNVDGSPLRVDVTAALDLKTGIVTWLFQSIDPATGLSPLNPVAGFLPVDDNTGRGLGTVNYTVRLKANLASGTAVGAKANVVFDANPALATNSVLNTIDSTSPTSTVRQLPALIRSTSFPVAWSGDDFGGSGITSYDVLVASDGGPFIPWLVGTSATSASFTGLFGHAYAFESIATDAVGHRQVNPATAQAATRLDPPVILQFSNTVFAVAETAGTASVVITRSGGLQGAVTVNLVTAGGNAVAGVNYSPVSLSLTFATGETSKIVAIPVLDDRAVNGDTAVALILSSPGGGATLGAIAAVPLVIKEADVPPPPAPVIVQAVHIETHRAKRGKSSTTIVIQFSGALDAASARAAGTYRLAQAGRDRKFGTKDDKTLAIASAAYDPLVNTVTLTPRAKLVLNPAVQLRIGSGRLFDALHQPLDGDHDGHPGGDFAAKLTKSGVSIASTRARLSVTAVDALLASRSLSSLNRSHRHLLPTHHQIIRP
jgi:RHS repeat-associated protein